MGSEGECPERRSLKRRKSTQLSIINHSKSKRQPPRNKSERHSARKPLNSILIKEVIRKSSKSSVMPTKFFPTPKRDNCMMNMGSRAFRMGDLREG